MKGQQYLMVGRLGGPDDKEPQQRQRVMRVKRMKTDLSAMKSLLKMAEGPAVPDGRC